MLTLPTNTPFLVIRLLCFPLVFIFDNYILNGLADNTHYQHIIIGKIKTVHLVYVVIFFINIAMLILIVSITQVLKVTIDTTTAGIVFIALFRNTSFSVSDIEVYFTAVSARAVRNNFSGLWIKLKDGRTISLADQNVRSVDVLRKYLEQQGIRCGGRRSMPFPFR